MRRITIALVVVGLATPLLPFADVSRLQAGTVLIDFEKLADGYNLNGLNLGGVTLTNPSGNVEVFDNRFGVGYHSATKAIASPAGLSSVNPLVGVFDAPVSYVSLWGGDSGWDPTEMDSWQLRAYDARSGGNLVGNVSSGSWLGSPYRQLSISAASILRFEALWTGPQFGIGYDDLRFVPVPPPPPPPSPSDPLPSNGSFDGGSDQDVLTINFDKLYVGDTPQMKPFDLWNLPSTGLTANLDLVSLAGSGHTGTFSTDLAPFAGLAPNASHAFWASIDTSTPGQFSATLELAVSDATGTPQPPLRIVLNALVVPEPSTLILAAAALLCLFAWGRRRPRAA